MLELVLRTLADTVPLATLSRGYGRKTTSIHEVGSNDDAERSGDEPVQVRTNFPAVRVFVGADRVRAIEQVQREVPDVKVVVLDDALQHRRLNAGLNILLTTAPRGKEDSFIPFSAAEGSCAQKLLRCLVGLAGVALLYFGLKQLFPDTGDSAPLFRFIRYGLVGFWTTYAAPRLFCKLTLCGSR